jgi:adenylate cyclase
MESDGEEPLAREAPAGRESGMTPGRRHDAGHAFAVNGEDAMVTVLFIDLRDFTRFADSATGREAVALLNEFFGVVVPVLESHGGRVSKFLGDGVNTGLVLVGTVGGGGHSELGVIGDPVNVAARAEQATRRTGDAVLVTEATRCMLAREDGLVPRGTLQLRGKAGPVAVYAPAAAR